MRSVIVLCIGVSLLGFAGVASAGQSGGTHAVTLQPTVVSLVQGTNNTVQLGLMIDGQFSYPFTFKADPPPDNGIALDSVGVLSGTPQKIADQNVTVRVTDSTGKSVAAYPLVIHVTNRLMVMLGTSETGAASSPAGTPASDPAPQATGKSQPPSPTFVLESMYTGGDTITGHLLPKAAPSDPSGPGNQKNLAGKPAAQAPAGGPNADPPPASLPTPENPAGAKPGNADPPGENQAAPAKVDAKANFEADTFTVSCTPRVPPGERIPACDANSTATVVSAADGSFSYQFDRPVYSSDVVSVKSSSGEVQKVTVQSRPRLFGEEMRSIVGYQQAGASSSDFAQNWFLDFYISRPLALRRNEEGGRIPWRWWGNVRIASFPQAGNQTLTDVATALPAQVGSLKLNQLAQGAEFLSGLEVPLFQSFPFRGESENTRQVFSLGLIAGFGATGFFSSPSNNVQVFAVPAANSPQLATFQKAFPGVQTPNVGFISPDAERFPKQYLAGLRLTTHYIKPNGMPLTSAPAMLAFTVGQNQVITAGHFSGVIGRVEAFYPMPFGERLPTMAGAFSSLYLFGTVQMKLGKNELLPALALQPASGTPASDPSVTLVPLANTRDEYRIGFGVDLVSLIHSISSAKQQPPAATTGKQNTDTGGGGAPATNP